MHLHPASFRDPDGTVILKDNRLFRLVFDSYSSHYNQLINSGLYESLSSKSLLVKHREIEPSEINLTATESIYKVLEPEFIPFISYPYEWSFHQLKQAALLTLSIQLEALEKNMSLKDASAFNVQFRGIQPSFIDTSSFEIYGENTPWQGYGQFCRHFLGPLLLWVYGKKEISKLSLSHIDGIPLNVISYSLPRKTKLNFLILSHIHLHASLEQKHKDNTRLKKKPINISKARLKGLLEHLRGGIEKLSLPKEQSEWTGYYDTFSYDKSNYSQKQKTVLGWVEKIKPGKLLDLGCNEGEFSILCNKACRMIVSADFDPLVINTLYSKLLSQKINNILPLIVDINNPTPGIGLNNRERNSFMERCNFDGTLALALIHHLTIGNNIPFPAVASMFSKITNYLVIEFVPKEDPQAQRLLITRKDIFKNYSLEEFINSFKDYFHIEEQQPLDNSGRILFRMKRHA